MRNGVLSAEKGTPAIFLLKFILFVLIFALVTGGVHYAFLYFLAKARGGADASDPTGVIGTGNNAPRRIVVLDAGHCGEDGGTSAADGTVEKDLNLSVTLLLADHLRACGVEVILTRDTDRLLYDPLSDYKGRKKLLDQRARLDITNTAAAENEDAEVLFVSIHMNSYPSESVRGLQVWYSPNNASSLRLADAIQKNAEELLGSAHERRPKAAGTNIFLLDRLNVPAVLVECGFLSCPAEAALLNDENYRRALAFTICTAILNDSSVTSPTAMQ